MEPVAELVMVITVILVLKAKNLYAELVLLAADGWKGWLEYSLEGSDNSTV